MYILRRCFIKAIFVTLIALPAIAIADVVYETLPGAFNFGAAGLGQDGYAGFAFRTPSGDAYAIDFVRLNLWNNTNVADPQFVVELYTDTGGDPGSLLATVGSGLIDPTYEVIEVATPAAPIVLEPDTTYWLMAMSPGNSISSVSWFLGGDPPTGLFSHVRGPVLWRPVASFIRDLEPQLQYLHVEINASLANVPEPNYSVTASVSGGNGNVSCDPNSVAPGGSSTCTAVPDAGWQVSNWTGACSAAGTSETCTLSNIQADQTSSVSFEAIPLTVVATVTTGNGGVSCDPVSVAPGGSSTCTAVPDAGWQVSGWTGACSAAGTSETCTLSNIQANQTSGVSFEVIPVTTYPIEFTVSGLLEGPTPGDAAYSVILSNNGGDDITVFVDGVYSFPTELADGASYDIAIEFQPDNQTCTVANGSGTVAAAPVTDPIVTCVDNMTPPIAVEAVPVPVDSRFALALLTIMTLVLGLAALSNRRY